jgi:hypothetical protein
MKKKRKPPLTPLSAEAQAARRPPPPWMPIGALPVRGSSEGRGRSAVP